MYPKIGDEILTYHALNAVGTVVGILVFLWTFHQRNSDKRQIIGNFLMVLLLILVGEKAAKMVRVLGMEDFAGILDAVKKMVTQNVGSHFIGRVLFTAWVYPLADRALNVFFRKNVGQETDRRTTTDALSFYFVIQHICNRLACFCNGCCYGRFYNGPGAVCFPDSGGAVFPAQLFECGLMMLLLAVLIWRWRRRKKLWGRMLVWFGLSIFLSEFFMNRMGINLYLGMTMIQFCAALLCCTGMVYIYQEGREEERK